MSVFNLFQLESQAAASLAPMQTESKLPDTFTPPAHLPGQFSSLLTGAQPSVSPKGQIARQQGFKVCGWSWDVVFCGCYGSCDSTLILCAHEPEVPTQTRTAPNLMAKEPGEASTKAAMQIVIKSKPNEAAWLASVHCSLARHIWKWILWRWNWCNMGNMFGALLPHRFVQPDI